MSRTSFRRFAVASLAAAILAIGLPLHPSAQAPPAPQWLRFDVATVKPDMVQEYEGLKMGQYFLRSRVPIATGKNADYRAYLKNDLKPVLEKGGVTWYRVSAPTFGGPAGTVETMRMLKNLGEIDGGPIQTKVLGAPAAQALNAKAAALTRGPAQTTIMMMRPDLSLLPPAMPAK